MKHLLLILIFLIETKLLSQNYVINGYVKDEQTKETIIGAIVFDNITQSVTTTNAFGFYSMTLKNDTIDISISYLGYKQQRVRKNIAKNEELNFFLIQTTEIEKITIIGEKKTINTDLGILK